MDRLRAAAWTALPLLVSLLAAGPVSASQPTPSVTYQGVASVRPGEQLTVNAKHGEAGYGDTMRSAVFIAAGKLRMMDPLLTTTVTIACEAKPGTYPVLRRGAGDVGPDEHPFRWARIRVEPVDEAARRACPDKVKKLPPTHPQERWAPGTTWPQSEWDVRTFRAGSRITITDNFDEGSDGTITLTSDVFTHRPVLRGDRAVLTATTILKCDAAPGLHVVYRHDADQKDPARPWARLRVIPAARGDACSGRQTAAHSAKASRVTVIAWTAGGALIAATVCLLFIRSRHAKSA
nr:hypothetical protein StreXyl84_79090 [Streptomyces sp. Xyl84]